MSDDALTRAARALRESGGGESPTAMATRSRILHRAALRKKRTRRAALVLLPLAATFVLSTAWAAAGGHLPALVAWLRGGPSLRASRELPSPPRASPSVEKPPEGEPPPESASATPTPTPNAPMAPEAPLAASSSRRDGTPPYPARPVVRPAAPSRSAEAVADAAPDPEDALYAAAHTAHFVGHDPAAALRAWDAYLSAYPNGRLALEARYNRALTLVRLGRGDEARAALAPFARGETGGYREREARALIEALGPSR